MLVKIRFDNEILTNKDEVDKKKTESKIIIDLVTLIL